MRNLRQPRIRYCDCFALGIFASTVAYAQNPTFALEGVVVDTQQAVLPGATVTVQNTATGLTRTVTTDESGRFVVRACRPKAGIRSASRSRALPPRCAKAWSSTPARTSC